MNDEINRTDGQTAESETAEEAAASYDGAEDQSGADMVNEPEQIADAEPEQIADANPEEYAEVTPFDPGKKAKAEKPSFMQSIYEWAEVFGYALAVMMLLFLFVFKYVSVDGSSMSPTFNPNLIDDDYTNDETEDRLIITNLFYTPKTGDVIVVTSENHDKPLIKRVIAVSGQKVKINFKEWKVWIDDELLDESAYLINGKNYFPETFMQNGSFNRNTVEFTVDEGKVFVMGDNRQNSLDSRYDAIGQLRIDDIMGKVIARVYPLNSLTWFG